MIALMKDLKAQILDVRGRLERQDSKDLELTRRVSALDHKYVSIAGVTEVLKNKQLETEKWFLSSLSQRSNRWQQFSTFSLHPKYINIFLHSQNETLQTLRDMISRGERQLNETVLSTGAADLSDEAKELLKKEIVEDLSKKQAANDR